MAIRSVGRHTYGAGNIRVVFGDDQHSLTIGHFCSIAGNILVFLGGNHRVDWVTTFPFGHVHKGIFDGFGGEGHPSSKGSVVIGNDVWIGQGVAIMSGVSLGDGAVIAANSHVVKNVEPYSVVGGNPARLIKLRFLPEQIQALLKIQWWNWPDAKINLALKLLCQPDIAGFIEAHDTEDKQEKSNLQRRQGDSKQERKTSRQITHINREPSRHHEASSRHRGRHTSEKRTHHKKVRRV